MLPQLIHQGEWQWSGQRQAVLVYQHFHLVQQMPRLIEGCK